ncbi:MAG: DUF1956 domain-containing protein [Verrucomicrobia bacterium]|nr:MAG: DUF1956 domain-containing protein [Verrucomicrobiota bacterium]
MHSRGMPNATISLGENKARALLLEAAGEVFAEQGFHGATIREITRRAKVNIAAVNYYFRDKAELYVAVLRHAHRSSLERELWERAQEGTAEERLRRFVHGLFQHLLSPSRPQWHCTLIARELAAPTPLFKQLIDEGLRPHFLVLKKAVQQVAGVPLSERKLQMIAGSILGQCFFYRHSRAVAEQLLPELYKGENWVHEVAEHIAKLSISAIRAEFSKNPDKSINS